MPTIIKAGQPTRTVRPPLARIDLADHLADARSVVDEARRKADNMVANARIEAHRLTAMANEDGYEAGYAEGYEKGRHDGYEAGAAGGRKEALHQAMEGFRQQHAAVAADLSRLVAELDQRREALCVSARNDLVEFAIVLATKLTFAIGRHHREAVAANFERALQLVQGKTRLTARVHPQDIEALQAFAGETLQGLARADGLRLVPDESIAPGGCVVSTDRSEVDARLETQLDEMVSLLLGRRNESPNNDDGSRPEPSNG